VSATSGVYWGGLHGHASDCSLNVEKIAKYVADSLKRSIRFAVDNPSLTTRQHIAENLYPRWVRQLEHYTKCQLSHDSDKLVALNGIAQEIENMSGSKLVWNVERPSRPRASVADPGWKTSDRSYTLRNLHGNDVSPCGRPISDRSPVLQYEG
jgi:hypothetical protein